ncbi:hypothetical protein GGI07_001343 [Coemansia sp. Benny D115]|nr:hypothetical protein GGI07_001343 [Coemansia sp. Benny D115]
MPRLPRRRNLPSFGTFSRLVPQTLVPNKPVPKEPSVDLVPAHIKRPPYARTGQVPEWPTEIPTLGTEEIKRLRRASHLARDALALGGSLVKAGVTTEEIDLAVHRFIVERGGYPSCLNYMGFPKSICTSVNNIIAHGIPDQRRLVAGDMINLDVTVYLDGFHGDTSAMFCVEHVDEPGQLLIDVTREALDLAIQLCGPGVPFKAIGDAIEDLAGQHGFSVSADLTGHGVGKEFHQNPLIFHHRNDEPGEMAPGMAFTIEPILCQGSADSLMWPDGWTISTTDGGRSAQYEHTVVVTQDGVDVLTAPDT